MFEIFCAVNSKLALHYPR